MQRTEARKIIDQIIDRGIAANVYTAGTIRCTPRSLATTFISGIRGPRNKLASEVTLCTSVERKKKKEEEKKKAPVADARRKPFVRWKRSGIDLKFLPSSLSLSLSR